MDQLNARIRKLEEQLAAASDTNQNQSKNIERLNAGIARLKPYREQFNSLQVEIDALKEKHAVEMEQQRVEHKLHEEALISQWNARINKLEMELSAKSIATTPTPTQPEEPLATKRQVDESDVSPIVAKKFREAGVGDVEIELHPDEEEADAEHYDTFDTEGEFYTHESFSGEETTADEEHPEYAEEKSPTAAMAQPSMMDFKSKDIDHPLEFITDMPPLDALTTEESQQLTSASEVDHQFLHSPEHFDGFSGLSPHAEPFIASENVADQEIDEEVIIPSATTPFKSSLQANIGEELTSSIPPKSRMIDLSRVSERTLPMKDEQQSSEAHQQRIAKETSWC